MGAVTAPLHTMTETFILITGRSSKQGTGVNAGKHSAEYRDATGTVEINQDDMARLGLHDGANVRLRTASGETVVRCKGRKPADLPSGTLFIAYGPPTSMLMDGDTAGTGMPESKLLTVVVEPIHD